MTNLTDWAALRARAQRLRHVTFVVVQKPRKSDGADVKHVVRELPLTEQLAGNVRAGALDWLGVNANAVVQDYTPGHRPARGELAAVGAADIPTLTELHALVSSPPLTPFSDSASERARIRMYGVMLGSGEHAILCLQKFSTRFTLRREGWIHLLQADDAYDTLEGEGFAFDLNFDIVHGEEGTYAADERVLEGLLGYDTLVQAQVDSNHTKLVMRLPFANGGDLLQACKRDARMATKLHQIVNRPYFGTLSQAAVLATAREFSFVPEMSNGHFVFSNDSSKRWKLLQLFDDDFLKSSMTQLRYSVNSKKAES